MTVYLYSGTPGSGKSLHATMDVLDALSSRNPRLVVANYGLDLSGVRVRGGSVFRHVDNADLSPALLVGMARDWWAQPGHRFKEDTIWLVLDECQLLFNCRDWQQQGRREWLSFFSQHRKYGFRIVLIAQFDRMVDRQIRSLIEYEYLHRKVSNLGRIGALVGLGGRLFNYFETYYPLKVTMGNHFFTASRRALAAYNSYDTFTDGAAPAHGAGEGLRGPSPARGRVAASRRVGADCPRLADAG